MPVYLCLPLFIRVSLFTMFIAFTYVYTFVPSFTRICLLAPFTLAFLPMFNPVYSCLPMFTHVYLRLPLFTRVYLCLKLLPMFSRDYLCLPVLKMGILIQKLVWEGHWDLHTSHASTVLEISVYKLKTSVV